MNTVPNNLAAYCTCRTHIRHKRYKYNITCGLSGNSVESNARHACVRRDAPVSIVFRERFRYHEHAVYTRMSFYDPASVARVDGINVFGNRNRFSQRERTDLATDPCITINRFDKYADIACRLG